MPLDKVWQMHGSGYLFSTMSKKLGWRNNKPSCVYLFSIGYNNLYKIGVAENVEARRHDLSSANPRLTTISYFEVLHADVHEAYLHYLFSDKRVEREIFEMGENEIDLFCTYFKNKKYPEIVRLRLKQRELFQAGKNRESVEISNKIYNLEKAKATR